jgi:hypothetical protein
MAKRQKNRQYNGQKTEEQTIQWPKEKGPTTIYKTLQRSSNTNPTKNWVTQVRPNGKQFLCG